MMEGLGWRTGGVTEKKLLFNLNHPHVCSSPGLDEAGFIQVHVCLVLRGADVIHLLPRRDFSHVDRRLHRQNTQAEPL